PKNGKRFSLSPRERAGVRGKEASSRTLRSSLSERPALIRSEQLHYAEFLCHDAPKSFPLSWFRAAASSPNLLAALAEDQVAVRRQVSELLHEAVRPNDFEPVHFCCFAKTDMNARRTLRPERVGRVKL